mmetsp:Transcript_4503/g.10447  ORF Transcript_4503/g.10447 Transcript_4503/m.10447 type:complete len:105 (-) Transcript_4503:697-1011(-)
MSLLDESLTPAPSGQISSEASAPGGQDLEDTTLDEPVIETIKRDLHMVWRKIGKVAIPSQDTKDELRNWYSSLPVSLPSAPHDRPATTGTCGGRCFCAYSSRSF